MPTPTTDAEGAADYADDAHADPSLTRTPGREDRGRPAKPRPATTPTKRPTTEAATDDDSSTSDDTPHPPLPALADSLPSACTRPGSRRGVRFGLMSRRSPLVHLAVLAVAWGLGPRQGRPALARPPGRGGGAGIWGFLGLLMACRRLQVEGGAGRTRGADRRPEIAASGWAVAGLATAVIGRHRRSRRRRHQRDQRGVEPHRLTHPRPRSTAPR
ncbi:hypothetical protein ACU686_42370 [Yinghuangia aomiensis]